MNLIYPKVENLIPNGQVSHVARCARVCYASETDTETSNLKLYDNLEKKGHTSMFRHESRYYRILKSDVGEKTYNKIYNELLKYKYCPYIYYLVDNGIIYVATNGDFARNKTYKNLIQQLNYFEVEGEVLEANKIAKKAIRHTFCITTQISTSRELNRTSPNNIAEQSTRYVNFGKKGGITICVPHWWDDASWFKKFIHKTYWKGCEIMYNLCLKIGMKPEDARGVLPLDTATRVVYTYNTFEWENIIKLRYIGSTGKPHPNAKAVIAQVACQLKTMGYSNFNFYGI